MMSSKIAISMGGNIGCVEDNFYIAVEALCRAGISMINVSPVFSTAPVDCPPGTPDFHNATLTACCTMAPLELLDLCKQLEYAAGRPECYPRNAPRPLDLDIILYGDLVFEHDRLQIPHPRALERRFVLEPLAAIAPEWIFPTTGLTVKQHFERLSMNR
ncbi:MAG: 2-amino-4-hydroxy-6-hydroxymethyldihydropteridine diphosphokinase [Victivallaceae bacterium]|nr:2-amino-4-hydroxy-6-hydroxymethyldihydropteridine diphosphokinase [Victivallaceae bacterium]